MKKPALLSTLAIVAAMSLGSVAMAVDYQSIRIFQTDTQFRDAVSADTVVVSLPTNLLLKRAPDSNFARKRIENVMAMRGKNGKIEKELVVRCDLATFTEKRNLILPNTAGTANPWRVTEVRRDGPAMEQWILNRGNSRLDLTCASFERDGDELYEIPLTASMINRALSSVNGSVLTEVQPAELTLNAQDYNNVMPSSAPVRNVEVAQ